MILYDYRHPKSFLFLKSAGFVSSGSVAPLPDLESFLNSLVSVSEDDQNYVLIPLLMEVLAAFYPAQDTQFTLNEYISELFPKRDAISRKTLLE